MAPRATVGVGAPLPATPLARVRIPLQLSKQQRFMCGSGRQKLPPHQIEIQANVNDSSNNNVDRDSDADSDSERDARRLKAKPKIHINNATSNSDGRRSSSSLCALPCPVPRDPLGACSSCLACLPATCHMPQLCVCPWQKPFGLFLRMAGATQSTPPLQASPGESAGSPQLPPHPPLPPLPFLPYPTQCQLPKVASIEF